MQERIGLILVDVYKMQKFQRNHSGVLPCPYRGEPWDRGWQMEHTTWRRTSLVLFDNESARFSVPHHSATVIGLIFLIVVILLDIVLF